ncbi:MAG: rhomboid family intramembrane serine protease [Saprospiraceae bacterium]|nr:rhomboid family intramembrane serine protease [Saprospiraceae bacterium]
MNRYSNQGLRNVPESVLHLSIINVLFFVVTSASFGQQWFGSLIGYYVESPAFRPWQIVTHMFMHGSFMHLLFNVFFGIYMFGGTLAKVWGNQRFLMYYFICGFGAFLLHQAFLHYNVSVGEAIHPFLGASGAVYGVLVAYAYLFPNTELFVMFIPIPIKAKFVVLGLLAIDIFFGFSGINSGIAHFAHLGGALTGFLLLMYWQRNKKRFY